jgi:hypothetical protein
MIECIFTREVRCVEQSPTLSAWQKWFPSCPTTGKAWSTNPNASKAQFSAEETCKSPERCCYVQFIPGSCR